MPEPQSSPPPEIAEQLELFPPEPAPIELGVSADGGDPVTTRRPGTERFKLREAITSIYNPARRITRPLEESSDATEEPELNPKIGSGTTTLSQRTIDPAELQRAAEVQGLILQAQQQAHLGSTETALKLLSQAVQKEPQNSEAWTWLGGLLAEHQPERARLCLETALKLDPVNERAKHGLTQIENKLLTGSSLHVEELLEFDTETDEDLEEADFDANYLEDGLEDDSPLDPTQVKIGLEEVLTHRREHGKLLDPQTIPVGGAQFRPALEKGELKLRKVWKFSSADMRQFRKPTGLKVSLTVLASFGLIVCLATAAAIFISVQPPPAPYTEPAETPVPLPTAFPLTTEETFASRIRLEIENYSRFVIVERSFRLDVQRGAISWDNYRQEVKRLNGEIDRQRKSTESLAISATPRLIPLYRELQTIASTLGLASDFTVSGVDNTVPEDLEEGNRQFNEAARRITELSRRLNTLSPIPTAPPTYTPRAVNSPTTSANPEVTSNALTPAPSQTVNGNAATPALTPPASTGTPAASSPSASTVVATTPAAPATTAGGTTLTPPANTPNP